MDRIEKITRHSEVSEKAIEKYLTDRVRDMGGVCLKYSNPAMAGYPDRVCLLPGGATVWIELKSRDGRLSGIQRIRIAGMRRMGHTVCVCRSRADIDSVLNGGQTV